jgi:hypothetical protein
MVAIFGELFDAPKLWACGCREPLAQVLTMGTSTWNTGNAPHVSHNYYNLSGIVTFLDN